MSYRETSGTEPKGQRKHSSSHLCRPPLAGCDELDSTGSWPAKRRNQYLTSGTGRRKCRLFRVPMEIPMMASMSTRD